MNKLLLSGFLITLAFSSMARPIENNNIDFHPNATNQTCQECEKIVDIIAVNDKILNKTITNIIEIVRGVCRDISGPSGRECLLVLDNIQSIMVWIANGLTAPVICHRLGFCSNSTNISENRCLNDF